MEEAPDKEHNDPYTDQDHEYPKILRGWAGWLAVAVSRGRRRRRETLSDVYAALIPAPELA
jgi:hypothetical protein